CDAAAPAILAFRWREPGTHETDLMNITTLPVAVAAPLAAMHAACFPDDPWDEAAMERILALAGSFGYLAWLDDEPAGFIVARDLGGESEILSLGVMSQRRRQGVATALLAAVTIDAGRRRSAAIVLE